jgi:hypothetical protein
MEVLPSRGSSWQSVSLPPGGKLDKREHLAAIETLTTYKLVRRGGGGGVAGKVGVADKAEEKKDKNKKRKSVGKVSFALTSNRLDQNVNAAVLSTNSRVSATIKI